MHDRNYKSTQLMGIKRFFTLIIVTILLLGTFLIFGPVDEIDVDAARANDEEPNNNNVNTAPLLMNDTVNGGVTDTDTIDYYKVNLHAGQTLSLQFDTDVTGTKNLTLKLLDKTLNELWSSGWREEGTTIYYNYTINRTTNTPYYLAVEPEEYGNQYTLITTIKVQDDAGSGTDAADIINDAEEIFGGSISGYLAGIDVADFYKLKISQGRIINFNMSVLLPGDSITFDIYDTTKNKIKSFPNVVPGNYVKFKYTTNSSGNWNFYISASITPGMEGNYGITLELIDQDDGFSYTDAADNFTAAFELSDPKKYTGWLAAGTDGVDQIDLYKIPVDAGNHSYNINITPNPGLNLMINVYNDTKYVVKAFDPGPGVTVLLIYNLSIYTPVTIYVEVRVDDGITSSGNYEIEYSIIPIAPPVTDTDNDNMPDAWELKYGLDPMNSSDAALDKDSDGYTNLQEYNADTDPTNPASFPGADISHLTVAACKRAFNDPESDVMYWQGTFNNVTNETTVIESTIGDYPNYDLVSLESARVDQNLVVKLKVKGKIEDLGDLMGDSEGMDTATFYNVFFVSKTYQEQLMSNDSLPTFLKVGDMLVPIYLVYINNMFMGTPGTTGSKSENGQTLEWTIPLQEISELPADFGLYSMAYNIALSGAEPNETITAHADSIGTGVTGGGVVKPNIITGQLNLDGRTIDVSAETEDKEGKLQIMKVARPEAHLPLNTASLDIFLDIKYVGTDTTTNILVLIKYLDSDVPRGLTEEEIRLFHFDESKKVWNLLQESGVWANNNTIWARPATLSVFAPLTRAKGPITIKEKIIDQRKVYVSIRTDIEGGEVNVEKPDTIPSAAPPKDTGRLDIYIDITLSGPAQPTSIFFTISYEDSDLPSGFDEKNIKIYYFLEENNSWVRVDDSGVWTNNNTIWAKPSHLTVFAPMAESGKGEGPGDDGDNWFLIILIIIIIVIVVAIAAGVAVARSRKARKPPEPEPERQRRALSPEFFECPRCGEEIEIPMAESEKVLIECPECHSKGKVDNPYSGREEYEADREYDEKERRREHEREYDREYDRDIDRDYDRDEEEVDIEYKPPRDRERAAAEPAYDEDVSREPEPEEDDEDYEYKNCPKCKEQIPVPYVESDKVQLKCPNCGAKGKVNNPYLK